MSSSVYRRIVCHDLDTFIATCAGLVQHGVTFSANTLGFEITLTGGY